MSASVLDAGTHWTNREESTVAELIDTLTIHEKQTDFLTAVESFYRNMAVSQRRLERS
jgi:predicted RNA methylase